MGRLIRVERHFTTFTMGQAHSTMDKTDLAVTTKGSVADGGTQGKLTMLTDETNQKTNGSTNTTEPIKEDIENVEPVKVLEADNGEVAKTDTDAATAEEVKPDEENGENIAPEEKENQEPASHDSVDEKSVSPTKAKSKSKKKGIKSLNALFNKPKKTKKEEPAAAAVATTNAEAEEKK